MPVPVAPLRQNLAARICPCRSPRAGSDSVGGVDHAEAGSLPICRHSSHRS